MIHEFALKIFYENNQQVHMLLYRFIIFSVACYVFRPYIVAIFREVFFQGILHRTLKQCKSIEG